MIPKPHATIADCVVKDFGAGVVTIEADHRVIDEKGRRVGGRVEIWPSIGGYACRIQATRDGVAFGASRRATFHVELEHALAAAESKIAIQRIGFRAKYGARS